ncbi:MAG: hypothetical protein AAFZ01_12925, partial [Pseudomonadota bacterium]
MTAAPTSEVLIFSRATDGPPVSRRVCQDWCREVGVSLDGAPTPLRAELAWEVSCGDAAISDDTLAALRKRAAVAKTDVNIVPAQGRKKKLLVADMESTIIAQECLDELARDVGIGEAVEAITARAMNG